jgi:hypothetical protein
MRTTLRPKAVDRAVGRAADNVRRRVRARRTRSSSGSVPDESSS